MSDGTFVQAQCSACDNDDVWLTCNACGQRSDFTRHADHISCHCGARYTVATCTCGAPVPIEQLVAVPFAQGPVRIQDFEVAWDRLAMTLVVLVTLGGLAWWLLT